MARPKARLGDGGRAKGKGRYIHVRVREYTNEDLRCVVAYRKGAVKGARERVELGEKSRTKFKRNPHKHKARRQEKAGAKGKSLPGTGTGESAAAGKIGSKRKSGENEERDPKHVRG